MIHAKNIPAALTERKHWVCWRITSRKPGDASTKIPFQVSGEFAESNNPATWNTFAAVVERYQQGGYDGIGYVFAKDDPFCGIDLDGCRDPVTGKVSDWAREIILKFNTYSEVSPSETGVKLFCVAVNTKGTGGKKNLPKHDSGCDKKAAVEIYDTGRFFAVTGVRLRTDCVDVAERQAQVNEFVAEFWPKPIAPPAALIKSTPITERACRYITKLPPAISGQGGHNSIFRAACVLILGFGLSRNEAKSILEAYNASCQPPFSDRELEHKLNQAEKQPGPRNYLRDVSQEKWSDIQIPRYREPRQPNITTFKEAASGYLAKLRSGEEILVELGLGDVDTAIGGGVAPGELVILAARPSHCKSASALQCIHTWTGNGRPCLMISEEMSPLMLGKRTMQFISSSPQNQWRSEIDKLQDDYEYHFDRDDRAECYIAESCGTAQQAIELIEQHVAEKGVQCVAVDYVQLLRSPGKSRYEQVTDTSIALRECATRLKIVMVVLAQLSRGIETRKEFMPMMSDLKDSGQIEQDADVILFQLWPFKLDESQRKDKFMFFVGKNRNREILKHQVECVFNPDRQMFVPGKVNTKERIYKGNYEPDFDSF